MQQQRTAIDRKRKWLEKFNESTREKKSPTTEPENEEAKINFPTEKSATIQSVAFSSAAEKIASTQSFPPFSQPSSTTAAVISVNNQEEQKASVIQNRKMVESRKYARENSAPPLPPIARPRTLYGLRNDNLTTRSAMSFTPTDPGSVSPAYIAGFRAAIFAAFNMAAATETQPTATNLNFVPPQPRSCVNINSMSDESPSSSANTTPSYELDPYRLWARFGQYQQQSRGKLLEDGRPAPLLMGSPTACSPPVVNDLQYQKFLDQVRNVEQTLRKAHN
uniref:Uncharacterized protein n=1 Tax=Plectus sambesii TaxID=2011161 RepID=A0A914XGM5_9BILA